MGVTLENTGAAASPHQLRKPLGRTIALPSGDGRTEEFEPLAALRLAPTAKGGERSRIFYAAPHVVASPLSGGNLPVNEIDWEATARFRDHLWDLGLGVAEAMDTAQRGMGLDWSGAKELIIRTGRRARDRGAALVCGAATDQLPEDGACTLEEIVEAYLEQCDFIFDQGATPVLMCSRQLARVARTTEDYRSVYARVLERCAEPVILHWLGEAFDPQLAGYWGVSSLDEAIDSVVSLIGEFPSRIDGIKVSVLSAEHEISMRRQLPEGVHMYTGDDYNYPELIRGDEHGHSDALLGVFNPLAPIAAAALDALDADDLAGYDALMLPTEPLAKLLFATPTGSYKSGITFLAYLNGRQSHFKMLNGAESLRSVEHYVEVFRLADEAGALTDPELAIERMEAYLVLAGVRNA
ncbi:MAG: dihydrodipicolinate synthase family protein [Leucobacter sp.]